MARTFSRVLDALYPTDSHVGFHEFFPGPFPMQGCYIVWDPPPTHTQGETNRHSWDVRDALCESKMSLET